MILKLFDLRRQSIAQPYHAWVGRRKSLSALAPGLCKKLHLYTSLAESIWVLLFTCLTVGVLVRFQRTEGTGLTYLLVHFPNWSPFLEFHPLPCSRLPDLISLLAFWSSHISCLNISSGLTGISWGELRESGLSNRTPPITLPQVPPNKWFPPGEFIL